MHLQGAPECQSFVFNEDGKCSSYTGGELPVYPRALSPTSNGSLMQLSTVPLSCAAKFEACRPLWQGTSWTGGLVTRRRWVHSLASWQPSAWMCRNRAAEGSLCSACFMNRSTAALASALTGGSCRFILAARSAVQVLAAPQRVGSSIAHLHHCNVRLAAPVAIQSKCNGPGRHTWQAGDRPHNLPVSHGTTGDDSRLLQHSEMQ